MDGVYAEILARSGSVRSNMESIPAQIESRSTMTTSMTCFKVRKHSLKRVICGSRAPEFFYQTCTVVANLSRYVDMIDSAQAGATN